MHQDIFRNAVHRSLSKSINPKELNSSSSSNSEEASNHKTNKEKRGKMKERGVEESVNAMIRSNFTELQIYKSCKDEIRKDYGTDFEMLSKNIAESLLKGAMDLQVSIDMLESFQKNVNRIKNVPNKTGNEAEEWFARDINANINNRYISDETSSDNSFDRLKKVISESLYKQNFITVSCDDEKSSLKESNSDDCNNSTKSPGIVVKLMGIREAPPKGVERSQPSNWDAKVKTLSSLRPVFDLERMPRVRRENPIHERITPNRKALLDIMETMQFKGLMRDKNGENEATTKSIIRVNERMPCRKVAKLKEMRTFKDDKIVEIRGVKGKNVDRKAAGIAPKIEKKTAANSVASKSVQRNKKNVVKMSSASTSRTTKTTQRNSTLPEKKKNVVVTVTSGSSNMTHLADRKTKKEGKGSKSKIQSNSNTTNFNTHPENNHKPKRVDSALSVEDNRTNWSVMYEALVDSNSTKSQEKQGKELMNFSGRSESDTRLLLLSNKTFTTFAKFDLKLYLDIAIEQVSRKNLQYTFMYPSYNVGTLARRSHFSIDKLVAETTHGIKKLADNYQNHMKTDDDLKDFLYVKLERDLQCSDLGINSIWSFGWSDWICVEEAGNVVCDVTDHVLSFLIEEIYS